jgi:hypothetical protein
MIKIGNDYYHNPLKEKTDIQNDSKRLESKKIADLSKEKLPKSEDPNSPTSQKMSSRRVNQMKKGKKEQSDDKKKTRPNPTPSKKRKDSSEIASTEKVKKARSIIDKEEFLYQYPIANSDVHSILASLDDQLKNIEQLNKIEITHLHTAIKASEATGTYPDVHIVSLGEDLGSGAFLSSSAKPIEKGSILGIYSGEYKIYNLDHLEGIDLSYAFELTEIIYLDEEEHLKFFGNLDQFVPNGDYVIYCDAKNKGNWTRFLNHGGKAANCLARLVRCPLLTEGEEKTEQWIVVVETVKKIKPGEQLLLNYGSNYWKKDGIVPKPVTPTTFKLKNETIIQK